MHLLVFGGAHGGVHGWLLFFDFFLLLILIPLGCLQRHTIGAHDGVAPRLGHFRHRSTRDMLWKLHRWLICMSRTELAVARVVLAYTTVRPRVAVVTTTGVDDVAIAPWDVIVAPFI